MDSDSFHHGLFQPASRREFLKSSLTGTLLLGCAGFLARCTRAKRVRPAGVSLFSSEEFATLQAFSQAVLRASAAPPAALARVPFRIDREISQWGEKNQSQVKSLLALLEYGTRYFFFSWRPLSELTLDECQGYLRGWETSRLGFRRQAFQALRTLAFFFLYSQDFTWKGIGYDGPWVKSLSH